VTGDVQLQPKNILLHINLPWALAMLADKLKPQIESEGKKLLSAPRHDPKRP
jgi:hypothetical protein